MVFDLRHSRQVLKIKSINIFKAFFFLFLSSFYVFKEMEMTIP